MTPHVPDNPSAEGLLSIAVRRSGLIRFEPSSTLLPCGSTWADPFATGFHKRTGRAATVHLGSALLSLGSCCLENNSFPCAEGFSAGARRSGPAVWWLVRARE